MRKPRAPTLAEPPVYRAFDHAARHHPWCFHVRARDSTSILAIRRWPISVGQTTPIPARMDVALRAIIPKTKAGPFQLRAGKARAAGAARRPLVRKGPRRPGGTLAPRQDKVTVTSACSPVTAAASLASEARWPQVVRPIASRSLP